MSPVQAALVLLGFVAVVGCAPRAPQPVIRGDADGVPIQVLVEFDRDGFERHLATREGFIRTEIVDRRDPFWQPYHHPFRHHHPLRRYHHPYAYHWHWDPPAVYRPAAQFDLLIGHGPAQAQFLRLPLVGGRVEATIPIRAGRTVVISLVARGGLSGWQSIDAVTIPACPARLDVSLGAAGTAAHLEPITIPAATEPVVE